MVYYRCNRQRGAVNGCHIERAILGLSIVKHVATNHGGEVTVWSEEGKGSTFTLRLPEGAASALTSVERYRL